MSVLLSNTELSRLVYHTCVDACSATLFTVLLRVAGVDRLNFGWNTSKLSAELSWFHNTCTFLKANQNARTLYYTVILHMIEEKGVKCFVAHVIAFLWFLAADDIELL